MLPKFPLRLRGEDPRSWDHIIYNMTRQIDRVILFISTLISHQFSVGYNFEQELVKNDREIDNIIVIVRGIHHGSSERC